MEYEGLSAELKSGMILLADGLIRLSVMKTAEKRGSLSTVWEDGGPVTSRKGIIYSGTTIDLSTMEKDKQALDHALKSGADWVAVSYVRNAEDLRLQKRRLKR